MVTGKLELEELGLVWMRTGLSWYNLLCLPESRALRCLCLQPAGRGPCLCLVQEEAAASCFLCSFLIFFFSLIAVLSVLFLFFSYRCASWQPVQWRWGWRVGYLLASAAPVQASLPLRAFLPVKWEQWWVFALNGVSKCLGCRNQKCCIAPAAVAHLSDLHAQMKWCFKRNVLWLERIVTCPEKLLAGGGRARGCWAARSRSSEHPQPMLGGTQYQDRAMPRLLGHSSRWVLVNEMDRDSAPYF